MSEFLFEQRALLLLLQFSISHLYFVIYIILYYFIHFFLLLPHISVTTFTLTFHIKYKTRGLLNKVEKKQIFKTFRRYVTIYHHNTH